MLHSNSLRKSYTDFHDCRALKFEVFQRVNFFDLACVRVSGEGEINSYIADSEVCFPGKFLKFKICCKCTNFIKVSISAKVDV